MKIIEDSILVNAPADTCYRHYMQFVLLPEKMEDVEQVEPGEQPQILYWKIKGPFDLPIEWQTHLGELVPDKKIAWVETAESDIKTNGYVHFNEIKPSQTRITATVQYEGPAYGLGEALMDLLKDPETLLHNNLVDFKNYVEEQLIAS